MSMKQNRFGVGRGNKTGAETNSGPETESVTRRNWALVQTGKEVA
jgi:hypothetical protein